MDRLPPVVAAAAPDYVQRITAVMMAGSAMMAGNRVEFRADHPFLFLIRHDPTGSILFMGQVNNPK